MPTGNITFIALSILYLGALLWIGLRARKQCSDEAGFFLAGRRLGLSSTTATLAATSIGGSATILVIGVVYARGLPFIWTDIAGGLGLILLGLFLAKRVRSMKCFSLPEIAGTFYGGAVRRIAAVLVFVAEIGFLALLLRGAAGMLQPMFQLPYDVALITIGAIFILYTAVGGQAAVARTDIIQLAVMAIGLIALLFFVYANPATFDGVPKNHTAFPTSDAFPPLYVLSLALIAGLPHLVGSDIYAKVLSARDGKAAASASLFSGLLKIGVGIGVGLIGLAAAGILPAGLPQETVLGNLFTAVLPDWASAIVVLAFLATLMSSADSVLLTAATVLSRDILALRDDAALKSGRIATAIVGIAGIVLAILFASMLSAFLFAYTLFSASLVLPILFGFWRENLRLNRTGAIAAMGGGAALVILGTVLGWPSSTVTLAGLGGCVALLFSGSYMHHLFTRKEQR